MACGSLRCCRASRGSCRRRGVGVTARERAEVENACSGNTTRIPAGGSACSDANGATRARVLMGRCEVRGMTYSQKMHVGEGLQLPAGVSRAWRLGQRPHRPDIQRPRWWRRNISITSVVKDTSFRGPAAGMAPGFSYGCTRAMESRSAGPISARPAGLGFEE
jgi:hypothetical protein